MRRIIAVAVVATMPRIFLCAVRRKQEEKPMPIGAARRALCSSLWTTSLLFLVGMASCAKGSDATQSVSAASSSTRNMAYITRGVGTFTDTSGNLYALDSSGDAEENGSPIPGGGGTAAMEYYSGLVYAQDSTSSEWFTWNQSTWLSSGAAPPTPAPALAYVTPGVGTFADASGHVYAIDSSGGAEENGSLIPGGDGTGAMEYYNGSVYGQDATTLEWYIWDQSHWNGPATAPPTPAGSSLPDAGAVDSGSGAPAPPGTRDPSRYPGADGRFWSLPLQTTAKWITSGPQITALHQGTPQVLPAGFWTVNWVVGGPGDPDSTITDGMQSFAVKVPVGTTAENMGDLGDDSLGGTDSTRPYLGWTCNGTLIDGSPGNAVGAGGATITCEIGLLIYDTTGPVMEDATTGNPWQTSDNAIGDLPDYELAQAVVDSTYVPPHTIAVTADPSQISSALAWPAINSDPGLKGPIPEGSTIGIPYNIPKPSGLSRGGSLLWDMFQHFGGIIYNENGGGTIHVSTYAQQASTQALVADMNNAFPSIMPYMAVLASDGSPGSETGPSTAKGMIGGVRADAFPAPAPLALSSTGVHPKWYSTGSGYFFSSP